MHTVSETAQCYGQTNWHLLKEKVGFPLIVDNTTKVFDKRYMRRFAWCPGQLHLCLFRCAAALSVVAADASTYQIFPCVASSSGLGHNVINCERRSARTAVLATAVVAPDNIAPREFDPFVRQMDVGNQADNAGVGQCGRDSMDSALFALGDKLGLGK